MPAEALWPATACCCPMLYKLNADERARNPGTSRPSSPAPTGGDFAVFIPGGVGYNCTMVEDILTETDSLV